MDLLEFLPKLRRVHILLSLTIVIATLDNRTPPFESLIMQLVKSEIVLRI